MSNSLVRMNFRPACLSLSVLAVLGSLSTYAANDPAPKSDPAAALTLLHQLDSGFSALFEKVAPSVVVIEARKKPALDEEGDESRGLDFLLREADPEESSPESRPKAKERLRALPMPHPGVMSEGSGFIIRADGYVLTNNHVIADAQELEVRFKDGRKLPAKLVGADESTDIAVLKVEAKGLQVVEMGDSDRLRIGQLVGAIGAPFNQDYSFSCGWVSGKGRTNLLGATSANVIFEDYIQTDAFINPGSSGGPLFDVDGRVIGMNTLINGLGRGLAFAIPSNMLVDVSAELIAKGRVQRPWLGIRIESLANMKEIGERAGVNQGVVVRTIEAEAPAYHSDLRPADIITEVDGNKVLSAHELQREVFRKRVGQILHLTVVRGKSTLQVPVATGELPANFSKVAGGPVKKSMEAKAGLLEGWGLKLADAPSKGALVVDVLTQTPALKAGMRPEDVITEVEGVQVSTALEASKLLSAAQGREKHNVIVNFERSGRRTFAILEKEK